MNNLAKNVKEVLERCGPREGLEPPTEIEEVREGQLPSWKQVRNQDLIPGEGCFDKVLLSLKFQDLHGLSLGIGEPHFRYPRLCVKA